MAAGISIDFIQSYLGDKVSRYQGLACLILSSSGRFLGNDFYIKFNSNVKEEDKKTLMDIFSSIGKAEVVDEELIHTVIGVSGSCAPCVYIYVYRCFGENCI